VLEEHAGNMHDPFFRHLDSQAGRAEIHLSESGLDPLGLRQTLKGLERVTTAGLQFVNGLSMMR
jgi:hypothetical protein